MLYALLTPHSSLLTPHSLTSILNKTSILFQFSPFQVKIIKIFLEQKPKMVVLYYRYINIKREEL